MGCTDFSCTLKHISPDSTSTRDRLVVLGGCLLVSNRDTPESVAQRDRYFIFVSVVD